MCTLNFCPYCGREAKEADPVSWFPVYTCSHCGMRYCPDDGPACPECASSNRERSDQVHPWVFE